NLLRIRLRLTFFACLCFLCQNGYIVSKQHNHAKQPGHSLFHLFTFHGFLLLLILCFLYPPLLPPPTGTSVPVRCGNTAFAAFPPTERFPAMWNSGIHVFLR